MRGIIFTEYLDFLEAKYSYETVDKILSIEGLSDAGAYTSVGKYPFHEMVALLVETSRLTQDSVSHLMTDFGGHVMKIFYKNYPVFFENSKDSITFLSSIEEVIHPQVLKLYPDAELPKFDIVSKDDRRLEMIYHSSRKMGDFALGLIRGCLDHFGETASVNMENISEDGTRVRFTIEK